MGLPRDHPWQRQVTGAAGNLFAGIPAELPRELETLLATGRRFRLERIVSRGHQSAEYAWYDQRETEWVILLSGAAELQFEDEDEPRVLSPGDYLMIPPHRRHRVARTAPDVDSVWLALYFDA